MGSDMSNSELRLMARGQLKSNWGTPIVVCLLFSLIVSAASMIPGIGTIVLGGPLSLGLYRYFIKLKRGEEPQLGTMFEGFNRFGESFLLFLLMMIFVMLWSLLFFIPGIIAGISYSQAFFIMNDTPGISASEALRQSKEMMRGYKGKYFMLQLSFIGWALLCLCTCGIGFFWLAPYVYTANANFYDSLKYKKEPF